MSPTAVALLALGVVFALYFICSPEPQFEDHPHCPRCEYDDAPFDAIERDMWTDGPEPEMDEDAVYFFAHGGLL